MKEYLSHKFSSDDPELVSVIDELPLWSAPFGMKLLDMIKMKKNIKVLDVGCGLGFPLIEIAQRLGNSSVVYGIDPWEKALERVSRKIVKYNIKNVKIINDTAEHIPFEDAFFDLIVSNNGINNVEDIEKTIRECKRVSRPGAQFIFTMNLDKSMIEFYDIFEEVLKENKMDEEIDRMKKHIYKKRRPLEEIKKLLEDSGFKIDNVIFDRFHLRFSDAYTMFNHSFIKYWFLDSWKQIIRPENLEFVFDKLEKRLNNLNEDGAEIRLTIPYAAIDCKNESKKN